MVLRNARTMVNPHTQMLSGDRGYGEYYGETGRQGGGGDRRWVLCPVAARIPCPRAPALRDGETGRQGDGETGRRGGGGDRR